MSIKYTFLVVASIFPGLCWADDEHLNPYRYWLSYGFIGYYFGAPETDFGNIKALSVGYGKSEFSLSADEIGDQQFRVYSVLYGTTRENNQVVLSLGASYLEKFSDWKPNQVRTKLDHAIGIPLAIKIRSNRYAYVGAAFEFRAVYSKIERAVSPFILFEFGPRK